MNSTTEQFFGEPIFTYSSQQAVEDGVLVAVTKQDCVTRSVWNWLATKTPLDVKPPNCWPVEMMGWFRAGVLSKQTALKFIAKHGQDSQATFEEQVRDDKALALSRGLIARDARRAIQAEEAGDIFTIYAEEDGAVIRGLKEHHDPTCLQCSHRVMYLRPNELGGVTLMFPEDN